MDRQYLQKQSDAKFRIDITDRMGNPRFTEGPLFARFRTRIYDATFPDGFYDIASGEVNTGIEVVDN